MKRVVLVDDEREILNPLKEILESENYAVETFVSPIQALAYLEKGKTDLAIFDIKMPQMTGHELLVKARAVLPRLPVIFLSSKDEEQDEIVGFTLGADDYITKPFNKHLLLARVAAVLRRHASVSTDLEEVIVAGQLKIDVTRHSVTWASSTVDLTVTECKLLISLSKNPGHVKNREQLGEAAYDRTYVEPRTIDSHVRNIRKKLSAIDPQCNIISTVFGLGYKLKIEE